MATDSGWTAKYGSILQTVVVLAIPFTALWIGAIAPLIANQDKVLNIREHDEYRRSVDARLQSIEGEILRLRSTSATKEDMLRQDTSIISRVSGQATRVMKIEDELHGSSNIGKSIDRMQEHLNEIDKRILGVVANPTSKP